MYQAALGSTVYIRLGRETHRVRVQQTLYGRTKEGATTLVKWPQSRLPPRQSRRTPHSRAPALAQSHSRGPPSPRRAARGHPITLARPQIAPARNSSTTRTAPARSPCARAPQASISSRARRRAGDERAIPAITRREAIMMGVASARTWTRSLANEPAAHREAHPSHARACLDEGPVYTVMAG